MPRNQNFDLDNHLNIELQKRDDWTKNFDPNINNFNFMYIQVWSMYFTYYIFNIQVRLGLGPRVDWIS